jgi:hypothetical protein
VLVVFCAVYVFIFAFGVLYIYRLLRAGPAGHLVRPPVDAIPKASPNSGRGSNCGANVRGGATDAFRRRPLSRAFRPFIEPNLKARLGSI